MQSQAPGSVDAGCPTRNFLLLSQSYEELSSWRIELVIVALSKRSRQPSVGFLLFSAALEGAPLLVEDNTKAELQLGNLYKLMDIVKFFPIKGYLRVFRTKGRVEHWRGSLG